MWDSMAGHSRKQPVQLHRLLACTNHSDLTLNLLNLGMHLEIVRCELLLGVEVLTTILTGIAGMDLAVMLFPLHLVIEGGAALFTAILFRLIGDHLIFSFPG